MEEEGGGGDDRLIQYSDIVCSSCYVLHIGISLRIFRIVGVVFCPIPYSSLPQPLFTHGTPSFNSSSSGHTTKFRFTERGYKKIRGLKKYRTVVNPQVILIKIN
jgi:hypothetical protein